jgi:iron uptake system component EfeO
MPTRTTRRGAVLTSLTLILGAALSGCTDDGASTREDTAAASGSGAASTGAASGSGTGSASGSGLAGQDLSAISDDPLVAQAVVDYQTYVRAEVDQLLVDSKVFTDAVRAGDLEAAKAAYAPSRVHWETIEPIAGLVEEIDGAVDARVDDFASETDPSWTGWHRLEYLLFDRGTTEGAAPFADKLDADLATLHAQIETLQIPPAAVAVGAAELIEEVSEGKITGEEDRYSGTDLWDFAANVDGADKVVQSLAPALSLRDAELLRSADAGIAEVRAGLEPYRDGAGWKPYSTLTDEDRQRLQAQLAALAERLSAIPGVLELS